jgi:hypothetical protein
MHYFIFCGANFGEKYQLTAGLNNLNYDFRGVHMINMMNRLYIMTNK